MITGMKEIEPHDAIPGSKLAAGPSETGTKPTT
jgi:hypothetical protein